MARTDVAYNEIGAHRITVKGDTSLAYSATTAGGHAGAGWAALALVVGTNDQYKLAADGEQIVAGLIGVEWDGAVIAQDRGFFPFKADNAGSPPAIRKRVVGALRSAAPGYIRAMAATPDTGEPEAGRGIVHNNADGNAVWVDLG